jgi:hypothetical protein
MAKKMATVDGKMKKDLLLKIISNFSLTWQTCENSQALDENAFTFSLE